MLRRKQLGVRFRRQHVIESFIVDFVCLEKKLVIEVDGDSHNDKKEYDEWRENILKSKGYKVLRITNEELLSKGKAVEKRLKEVLEN